ncbi:hypothetical protein [Kitasatospora sp. NBC_01266]|uniref:hypothetical protein n=1 Tax=Kitasatospora sp. NBC_01266 TaxID=2903572 RepID=UPI002E35D278|nr:hypothetical protein [Kitasatospora sp. NBC_01266]
MAVVPGPVLTGFRPPSGVLLARRLPWAVVFALHAQDDNQPRRSLNTEWTIKQPN